MNDTGITLSREDADTIFRILGKSRDAVRKVNPNLAQQIQGAQQLLVEPDGGEEAAQETEPDTAAEPAYPVSQAPEGPIITTEEPEGDNVESQDESDEPEGSDDESTEEDTEETASQ